MAFERYAIYWAPPASSELAYFGRAWLGVDAERGAFTPSRNHFGLDEAVSAKAVTSPARYTLHATMKAPFRLADERSEQELAGALADFCAKRRRVTSGPLQMVSFDRYLALIPAQPLADLEWLAAECVTHFDRFRAALNDNDRARRVSGLTASQTAQFEAFGYPHIFNDFKFHITLAGPLDPPDLARVHTALSRPCAAFTQDPFTLRDLCLFGDPGGSAPFRLIERFAFMR